jgi:type II secretory ATPase GspE/PulE/Tfp pilus assembly ATPase PilB-like protein
MLSSDGKPTDTRSREQKLFTNSAADWQQRREQVFYLIDNLLSFEACLYHQVAPFGMEGNQLLLGMVHPQDSQALDYVNRIVSYLNSTLVAEEISTETHRRILSDYLNYKNTFRPDSQQPDHHSQELVSQNSKTTIIDQIIASATATSPSPEQSFISSTHAHNRGQAQQTRNFAPNVNPPLNLEPPEDPSKLELFNKLTVLQIHCPEEVIPVENLASLPPKKLLEELLTRVLSGGIGRLYLERQPYQGRIFWSDNGVMQSVLENLPLSVFQGVLNQLKTLASLPVSKLSEPKQVEKECLYQNQRLLLRLRFIPGTYGEEATLQVLRGSALKFYQQQQLARLSRDACVISQQLSLKLHELQERMILNSNLKGEQLACVIALNKLIQNLDHQIKILRETSNISKNI